LAPGAIRFINLVMVTNNTGRKTVKGRTTSAPKISKSTEPEAVVTAPASTGKAPPSQDAIALLAYELYLKRGREDGHQTEDWLAAERALSA
jgi:hypothetical protein